MLVKNLVEKKETLTRKLAKNLAGQLGKDTGGGYSYPLVEPRPEEVLDIDNSTEVLSTGAERSLATIHVKKINPIYFQHMTGGARQGEEHGKDRNAKKITKTLAEKLAGSIGPQVLHEEVKDGRDVKKADEVAEDVKEAVVLKDDESRSEDVKKADKVKEAEEANVTDTEKDDEDVK